MMGKQESHGQLPRPYALWPELPTPSVKRTMAHDFFLAIYAPDLWSSVCRASVVEPALQAAPPST